MNVLDDIGSKSENEAGFSTSGPWHTICYIYCYDALSTEQSRKLRMNFN